MSALQHAQQLGASSPASPDVEVPQVEVLRARVEQPHPAAERQPLAAGVGDGVAQPRVPQQLGVGELLPAIQRDAFRVRLGHPHKGALGHLAAGAHQPQPGPNSHRLRGVGCGCARRLVLNQHGVRGRQAPVLALVDLNPVGVGEHEAHVGVLARRPRELAAASAKGTSSASPTRSQLMNWKMRSSERRFSVSSWQ